jgi:hydrogenase expression/formation protein HypE
MAELRFRDTRIEMAHGAGGKASRRLIEGLFLPLLANPELAPLDDAAVIELGGHKLALTTDSFVVKPLLFPGGSIGTLAVHGTANDLAVSGAEPLALLATFILEAGLEVSVLEREVRALSEAAEAAGVAVVAGDTKVVEHGKADGLYLTTAGFGLVDPRLDLSPKRVQPGDQILLSGPIGDHGITVLLARGEVDLEADLQSDTRSVWPLVEHLIGGVGMGLRWMRDPTRGGVASALSELARDADLGITFDEEAIPVRDAVRGACELLGLDPLHIANEGQFVAVVASEHLDASLAALHAIPGGEHARRIGSVTGDHRRTVVATTPYGGSRVVDMLVGDPLPRIC